MATTKRFQAKYGLDNGSKTIIGVSAANATIDLAGNLTTTVGGVSIAAQSGGSSVTFPSSGTLVASGAIANSDINASAAIAYSKLALTGSIVNADIASAAAIAYSKLNLTGGIVNADISASAAIANSKLANSSVTIGSTSVSLGASSTTLAGMASITFAGATSGTVQVIPTAAVGTGTVLTIPALTGTVAVTDASQTVSFGDLTCSNLTVNGTTTTVNTTNLEVTDKNILVAKGNTATATADTAGITIDATTPITFQYNHASTAWKSSVDMDLASGKVYRINGSQIAASNLSNGTTGSGKVVLETSATLVTPTLGVASATSINKVAITAPATGSTLTIADGKTLTASNTLTFTGTDSSSVAFGAGGTVAYTSNKLSAFAATSSSELAGVISDETGSGSLVFANSPSLVTPTLGVASATSINKVAITAPATGSTLTIADGKTLTASNTLTFTGNDGSSVAFGGGGTVIYANSPTLTTPNIGDATATSISYGASSLAKTTGFTQTLTGTAQTLDTFDKTVYRAAKYMISAKSGTGATASFHVTEFLVMADDAASPTAYVTEYGTVSTADIFTDLDATVASNTVTVKVTPTNASTVFNVYVTYVKA